MNRLQIPKGYLDTKSLKKKLELLDSSKWVESGRRRTYRLFKDMSSKVPAYKKFLSENSINSSDLKNYSDLKQIPAIDKDNYLRKYHKQELCFDGKFGKGPWVISTTSGSTGEPYYFPRQPSQDWQYALTAEQYLLSNFHIDQKKTLYIVGFPMGAWIGGVFTYEAIKSVAKKGYDLSVITPGIHKIEILNAIKQLAGFYDQIIIGAYAPFLKDILEDGERLGIAWKDLNVKFIFSAEAFSENFRDYIADKVGLKNILLDTLNHYGTVDMGTMAHETPLSILIRRKLFESGKQTAIFPETHRQPTLCQYNPDLFFFEEKQNNLYCSAYSGLPLFRYDLKDYGGVISYKEMIKKLQKAGIDILKLSKAEGIESTIWQLPFVYVYERNDFSVSYFAFNLYPDPVRKALHRDKLQSKLTGKFTMEVKYDNSGAQKLVIHAEKKHGITSSSDLKKLAIESVHSRLLEESTEYPEIFRMYGSSVKPKIIFYEYEHQEHFKPGTKQKWVKK
jgi:phenylacetate-CoA ligase